MSLSIIVARAANGVIGRDNQLLWHMKDDMAWFKKTTMNHAILMGRKTFESLPKLLPGRTHYILTGDQNYRAPEGVHIFHHPEDLLASLPEGENFVIGGGEMYKLFFDHAEKLYITEVEKDYEGDTYFPNFDEGEWNVVSSAKGEGDIPHRFVIYKRK